MLPIHKTNFLDFRLYQAQANAFTICLADRQQRFSRLTCKRDQL
nr:MAG TPA: hypothetical protein [Caudoviricetes sp.]